MHWLCVRLCDWFKIWRAWKSKSVQIFDKSCITSCRPLLNVICIILPKLIDYFLRCRQEKAALANSYQIFFDRYNIAWLWREIFLFCKSNNIDLPNIEIKWACLITKVGQSLPNKFSRSVLYLHNKAISANDVNSNFKGLKGGNICSVVYKIWHQNKILSVNKSCFHLTATVAFVSLISKRLSRQNLSFLRKRY